MLKIFPKAIFLLVGLLFVVACGGRGKQKSEPLPPTEQEVREIYDLYLKGDYRGYVDRMHSVEGKPEDYKRQMVNLYKQNARNTRTGKAGGVVGATLGRIETGDSGRYANVFLNITYKDSTVEEVILPMVYVSGKWLLR